ncbi:MAG: T9SS type A sorting domain-containing protein [Bacteroidetes bacterium]|nr:T9SS type A sorting domain-containing protein [Bacteroidota bacterium]
MKQPTTLYQRNLSGGLKLSAVVAAHLFYSSTHAQTTFNYTGGVQTYTVPVGVTSIGIDVNGAQGGAAYYTSPVGTGGLGGRTQGVLSVTPGEVLQINVGGVGGNAFSSVGGSAGYNGGANGGNYTDGQAGGGGGGASDIRRTPYALSDRAAVAGGGGGAASCSGTGYNGGAGGGLIGGTPAVACGTPNNSSTGGTQSAGGMGGSYTGWCSAGSGIFGSGASGCSPSGGGGGGGGYYGGGGGAWMGGGGGSSFTNGTVTSVTLSQGIRNGNGQIIISILYYATITQTAPILCNGQSTGSLTATPSGGTSPYTYSWSPTGGTSATASGLPAGTYTVTVTDASMNVTTQTFALTQPTPVTMSAASQTNVNCNGGMNGSASVNSASGGIGPYSYDWTPGTPAGDGTTGVTGLAAGTWTCTVTDANSCTATQLFTITEPSALSSASSATSIACNGGTSTVTVTGSGGTAPYTGTGTFTVSAGTYSYLVTDANGCTSTTNITVTEPTLLVVSSSATDALCNGGNGTITVFASGGTAPYTGTGVFSVTAGTYSYIVTDANGCTSSTSATVAEPTAISTSVAQVNVSCNGGSDGSITLTVSGGTPPYSFNWNSGTYFTQNLSGLTAGTYSGVLTDANGCTDAGIVVITEPPALVATITSATNASTCGGTDGAIDITVTGGTPGYMYLWNTSVTTEDISGVSAGTYSNTVTDTNGCTTFISVDLTDPNPPSVTLALAVDTVCAADGIFALSGGSPAGGSYSGTGVSAGSFDPSAANAGNNTITYTYTDGVTGCTGTSTGNIFVDACTGINSAISVNDNFSILPNPNNGTFTFVLQSNESADVMIYDALGQLVNAQKVQPGVQQQLNIAKPGVFMVTVVTADGHRSSQRVVVNK